MVAKATDTDISAQKPDEAFKPSLLKAFSVFEKQCQLLEESHKKLKAQLDEANLELESKNIELAQRLTQIEGMRERLSGILETITDAVFLIDEDVCILPQNHAAQALLETLPELAKHPELQKLVQRDEPVRELDLLIEQDESARIFMVTMLHIVADEEGRLLILKDVTEYRELLRRVEREDRLSALGHVAANVAHEIRNPLQAVEGFVQLLSRDISDNPLASRQVDRIMQAARQLNGVVGNLLGYTREVKLNVHPCSLIALATEVVEMNKSRAASEHVELELIPGEGAAGAILDSIQIKQVISNLVCNAVEACANQPDKRVEVTWGEDERHIFVEVKDNGPGMTEEVQERIFEPFYTSKSGGIGLGLALCRRIVDAHSGRIVVKSEPGKGTSFRLIFPKAQER